MVENKRENKIGEKEAGGEISAADNYDAVPC